MGSTLLSWKHMASSNLHFLHQGSGRCRKSKWEATVGFPSNSVFICQMLGWCSLNRRWRDTDLLKDAYCEIKFSDFGKNVGKQYQKVSWKWRGEFCMQHIGIQLTGFALTFISSIRRNLHEGSSIQAVAFTFNLQRNESQNILQTAWFCLLGLNA